MSGEQLLALFTHFLSLSIFATGGAIALASDMHRYVVDEHAYITHTQFVNSIALAQAAPGPNILFVTVMGWQIAGLPGALATTVGLSLPALVFPGLVSRLSRRPDFERIIKSLQLGLGPLAIGLMASTCFVLAREAPGVLRLTRVPPVVLILTAGVVGAFVPW